MEPFAEKPIRPLFHFIRTELEANGGASGCASHKFNAICHGRETAEITEVEKLHKSEVEKLHKSEVEKLHKSMQCFNLGARMRRG